MNNTLIRSLTVTNICVAWVCFMACTDAQEMTSRAKDFKAFIVPKKEGTLFLHDENRDFRWLILTPEAISSMEARSVCFFYLYGYPLKKAEPGTTTREIPIKGNETVRSILDAAGMKRWTSGQPQIKLISKCAILQSPLTGKRRESVENEDLLLHRVNAGDIIMVSTVQ